MGDTADLLSALDNSSSINTTAANTSSVYTALMSPTVNKAINILLIIVLFITMVSLGCTMEVSKIKVTHVPTQSPVNAFTASALNRVRSLPASHNEA